MSNISRQFTRNQRSALSFFVMTAIAGYVTLFLIHKANDAINEIDELVKTPYYLGLKLELEGVGADANEEYKTMKSPLGFSLSYPSSWTLSEKNQRAEFYDPSMRKQGIMNAVARIELVQNITREEAVREVFFIEENGLYFAIGRLGNKGDPATEYLIRGKEVLVGDTIVALYDRDGTYLGLTRNYSALVSQNKQHAIIHVLYNRKILDEIISSFVFIN